MWVQPGKESLFPLPRSAQLRFLLTYICSDTFNYSEGTTYYSLLQLFIQDSISPSAVIKFLSLLSSCHCFSPRGTPRHDVKFIFFNFGQPVKAFLKRESEWQRKHLSSFKRYFCVAVVIAECRSYFCNPRVLHETLLSFKRHRPAFWKPVIIVVEDVSTIRRNPPKKNHWVLFSFGAFSLTSQAVTQVYWNKRKLLRKEKFQFQPDRYGSPIWPSFHWQF